MLFSYLNLGVVKDMAGHWGSYTCILYFLHSGLVFFMIPWDRICLIYYEIRYDLICIEQGLSTMTVSCRVVRLDVIIQHFVVVLRTHSVQTRREERQDKSSVQYNACFPNAQWNLLKITAKIRRTRTVMIAMVIIRFVAILQTSVSLQSNTLRGNFCSRCNTYGPSPSASLCSCPRSPRSAAARPSRARSSPAAGTDRPACSARCPPSRARYAGSPAAGRSSVPDGPSRTGAAVSAPGAGPPGSTGHPCSGHRREPSGRLTETSACASTRRCRCRSCGSEH